MGGAVFILGINLTVSAVLAAGFLVIGAYARSSASARWIALAYGLGVAYFALEFLISVDPGSRVVATAAYAAFLAALAAYAVGLASKFAVRPPWLVLAILFAVSIAVNLHTQTLPRDSLLRNMLWQTPYAVMQAVSVAVIYSAVKRDRWTAALGLLLAASALHFLAKPFIAMATGGPGDSPRGYLESTYAMFSQSLGSVLAFSVALMTVAVYVRSMLGEAMTRSETDELSGLLNRRGFEDRSEALLLAALRKGSPVSLVICDIDRFKTVNDTFGHEAGDRVIEAFAAVLRNAAGAHPAGRIGGEEFAIALSGVDLQTARLVAEGARIAFSEMPVAGLEGQRCTASFGVAEWRPGETHGELLRRADMALYEAKDAGRDCVRMAPPGKARPAPLNDDGERRLWRGR